MEFIIRPLLRQKKKVQASKGKKTGGQPTHVIGEETAVIGNSKEGVVKNGELAEAFKEEAIRLLDSHASEWSPVEDKNGIFIESRPVENSSCVITRGSCTVDASAEDVFAFLTSVEGFKAIDPASDHDTDPVAILECGNECWATKKELTLAIAKGTHRLNR